MKKIVKKHPLAIRWFHWINFPLLAIMIWSGLLIYWANDVFKIRFGGTVLFQFFPESFYHQLHISHRLAEGMAFHFVFMWFFFGNGLLYVLYTAISGEWRELLPNRHSWKEAWQVLLHDLHIRRSAPPQKKYNGAQRIAYTAIIVMGLGSVLTGLAIYKPVQFYWLCALLGGYETARIIHFILTIGYCLFFVIHIVQVILAGWDNFRSMVTGFSVVKANPPQAEAPPSIDHAPETYAPIGLATGANLPIDPSIGSILPADQTPEANQPAAMPAETEASEPIPPAKLPAGAGADLPEAKPAGVGTSPHFFRRIFGSAFGQSEALTVHQQIQRRTIVSLSIFALLGGAAWKSWFWLKDQGLKEGVQEPLRKGLDTDEKIFRSTLSPDHQARTYPPSAAAGRPRVNGNVGVGTAGFDPKTWKLQVTRAGGSTAVDSDNFYVTIDELRSLPKTEIIFDFKCIEGWSQVSHWGGVKFSDFMRHYGLAKEADLSYAGFLTPDKDYYVGIDMPSALHPQTLLCYEMNGAPLPMEHGAPLRLIIPVKYGVKNLKRIGSVYFSADRPNDYWFERGYDYYSGL